MKQIQYSGQLLVDIERLMKAFQGFAAFNLIHADQNLEPKCKIKMGELIKYSNQNSRLLYDFFKEPILSHEEENKEKLMKNINNLMTYFYNYVAYAEPILKKCRPDIYKNGFLPVKKRYLEFYAKYFA